MHPHLQHELVNARIADLERSARRVSVLPDRASGRRVRLRGMPRPARRGSVGFTRAHAAR